MEKNKKNKILYKMRNGSIIGIFSSLALFILLQEGTTMETLFGGLFYLFCLATIVISAKIYYSSEKYLIYKRIVNRTPEEQQKEEKERATSKLYEKIKNKKLQTLKYRSIKINDWISWLSVLIVIIYAIILVYNGIRADDLYPFGFYLTIIPTCFAVVSITEFSLRNENEMFEERIRELIYIKSEAYNNIELRNKYKDILSIDFEPIIKELNQDPSEHRIITDSLYIVDAYDITKVLLYLFWIFGGLFIIVFFIWPQVSSFIYEIQNDTQKGILVALVIIIFLLAKNKKQSNI